MIQLRKKWKLHNASYYIKGEKRFPQSPTSKLNSYSGIGVLVSDADFDRLDLQIKDAIEFLRKNETELNHLNEFRFKEMKIDFGIEKRDVWAQFDYFPPLLLKLAGNLNIGMEISQYAPAEPQIKQKSRNNSVKKK